MSWALLAFQLLVDVCHLSIHHFALDLLQTRPLTPTALSKLLIYASGLSCIAFVGIVGGQLQRKQNDDNYNPLDNGKGNTGSVILIVVSFVAEGLTLYLLQ